MKTGPIDLRAVRRMHAQFKRDNRHMVNEALEQAGEFGQDHVRAHSKFKRRSMSGSLKDATTFRVVRGRHKHRLILRSPKKYAAPIDLGARPHVIRPRRRHVLRFVKNGRVVFARSVNHPGNRPYRFLWKANHAAFRWASQKFELGAQRLSAKRYK